MKDKRVYGIVWLHLDSLTLNFTHLYKTYIWSQKIITKNKVIWQMAAWLWQVDTTPHLYSGGSINL